MIFKNRHEAGRLLAKELGLYKSPNTIILGLARGGVVIAAQVARELNAPIDALVVKKITGREDPELAIGAIAPDRVMYIDWKLANRLGIDEDTLRKSLIPPVEAIIRERMRRYHKQKTYADIRGKDVILVDDGAATGATMEAAIIWTKKKKCSRVVVALPMAPIDFYARVKPEVDAIVVLDRPADFRSVGQFYEEFPQVSDEEVVQLLENKNKNIQKNT